MNFFNPFLFYKLFVVLSRDCFVCSSHVACSFPETSSASCAVGDLTYCPNIKALSRWFYIQVPISEVSWFQVSMVIQILISEVSWFERHKVLMQKGPSTSVLLIKVCYKPSTTCQVTNSGWWGILLLFHCFNVFHGWNPVSWDMDEKKEELELYVFIVPMSNRAWHTLPARCPCQFF